jgi:hypothetical protein
MQNSACKKNTICVVIFAVKTVICEMQTPILKAIKTVRHCDEGRRSNLALFISNHNNQCYLRSIKMVKHRIKK